VVGSLWLGNTGTCCGAFDGVVHSLLRNHGGKPVVSTQHPINQRLRRVQITALHCRFSNLVQDKPR
jgi:hypothetical protein